MANDPYATYQEFLDWLRLPTDTKLDGEPSTPGPRRTHVMSLLQSSSRTIDRKCGRDFRTTYVGNKVFYPRPRQRRLFIGDFQKFITNSGCPPGVWVGDVDFSCADEDEIKALLAKALTNFDVRKITPDQPATFLTLRGKPWRGGSDNDVKVTVRGTWGWSEVPASINTACLIYAARLYQRPKSPLGVQTVGEDDAMYIRKIDPDLNDLIDNYRIDTRT